MRARSILANVFKKYLFVLICLILFVLVNCTSNNKPSTSEILPSQIVTDFLLYESISGKRLYRLYAQKAYVYDSNQKIEVIKPFIIFYNEDGSVYSTLNAVRGKVNMQTSDLYAYDSVLVQTADSTILNTDSLAWNNQKQIIITDAQIKIQSKQGLIEGRGLESDAGLKKIEIKSSVTGKSHYEF